MKRVRATPGLFSTTPARVRRPPVIIFGTVNGAQCSVKPFTIGESLYVVELCHGGASGNRIADRKPAHAATLNARGPPLKKALIVDDDPIIRNLIGALLRRRGLATAQAANGDEAILLLQASLDASHRSEYDLVVLDLMMPKVSGWDVIRFIVDELPALKSHVVVISALGEPALDEIRVEGLGAVIPKPFDTEGFYAAVESSVRTQPDAEGEIIVTAVLCLAVIAPLL